MPWSFQSNKNNPTWTLRGIVRLSEPRQLNNSANVLRMDKSTEYTLTRPNGKSVNQFKYPKHIRPPTIKNAPEPNNVLEAVRPGQDNTTSPVWNDIPEMAAA